MYRKYLLNAAVKFIPLIGLAVLVLAQQSAPPQPQVFRQVTQVLKSRYIDPQKIDHHKMLLEALKSASHEVPPLLYTYDTISRSLELHIAEKKFSREIPEKISLLELTFVLEDISKFIKQNYDIENFDTLDFAMTEAMVGTLDPHTVFLKPDEFERFNSFSRGSYQGVGMVITLKNNQISVEEIFRDSPAQKAGIKAGDIITSIDGQAIEGLGTQDVSNLLLGEEDTPVIIRVIRKTDDKTGAMEFKLIRQKIQLSSVTAKEFKNENGRVGYIQISSFQENTYRELNAELDDLNVDLSDFNGIILDLRNNPGGLLTQAIRVSNKFLSDGAIVYVAAANDTIKESVPANPFYTIEDVPLIVLINENSASASEIVSAAVKKNNRGILIGRKTFGKGSVQDVINLSEETAIKVTTSKYLTPSKISIQSLGVQPTIQMDYFFPDEEKNSQKIFSSAIYQHISESNLDNNFAEWGNEKDVPDFSMAYFTDSTKENGVSQSSGEGDSVNTNDFILRFAVSSLNAFSGSDQKGFEAFRSFVIDQAKNAKQNEDKRFKHYIEQLGIPWNHTNTDAKIEIDAVTAIQGEKSHTLILPNNAPLELRLKIKNTSAVISEPLMLAITEDNGFLPQQHYVIGNIKPDKEFPLTVPLTQKAGKSGAGLSFHFSVYSYSGDKLVSKKLNALIKPNALMQPVNVTFETKNKTPDKTDTLNNTDTTSAKRFLADLTFQSSDLSEKALSNDIRFKINTPGVIIKKTGSNYFDKEKKITFQLEILINQKITDPFIDFSVFMSSQELFTPEMKIHFPFGKGAFSYKNQLPQVRFINTSSEYVDSDEPYSILLTVSDDKAWNNVTAFLNGQKILFQKNRYKKKKSQFELDSLKMNPEAHNNFLFTVVDNEGLSSTYKYSVLTQ